MELMIHPTKLMKQNHNSLVLLGITGIDVHKCFIYVHRILKPPVFLISWKPCCFSIHTIYGTIECPEWWWWYSKWCTLDVVYHICLHPAIYTGQCILYACQIMLQIIIQDLWFIAFIVHAFFLHFNLSYLTSGNYWALPILWISTWI